MATTVPRQTQ